MQLKKDENKPLKTIMFQHQSRPSQRPTSTFRTYIYIYMHYMHIHVYIYICKKDLYVAFDCLGWGDYIKNLSSYICMFMYICVYT